MLILKRKCLVGASWVRCRESGTPSTIIYTRWSSRRYELGCDAPVACSQLRMTSPKSFGFGFVKTIVQYWGGPLKNACINLFHILVIDSWYFSKRWGSVFNDRWAIMRANNAWWRRIFIVWDLPAGVELFPDVLTSFVFLPVVRLFPMAATDTPDILFKP